MTQALFLLPSAFLHQEEQKMENIARQALQKCPFIKKTSAENLRKLSSLPCSGLPLPQTKLFALALKKCPAMRPALKSAMSTEACKNDEISAVVAAAAAGCMAARNGTSSRKNCPSTGNLSSAKIHHQQSRFISTSGKRNAKPAPDVRLF